MGADRSHLNEVARALLDGSDENRILAIEEGSWIPYQRAVEILQRMEELLNYPRVTRMPNMLLVAPSNNGKSSILKRFMFRFPTDPNIAGDAIVAPVVLVEAPSTPDTDDLYCRILQALSVPYKPSAKVKEKYHQVKTLFLTIGVRMLIIEEIQHLIAGSLNKQRDFRNAIKSLSNETQVVIVASGIEDAFNAFNTDEQLSSRFVPEFLPKWRLNQELGSLLMTLERRTPLKQPSGLADTALAQKILWLSEGTIGDICDLVKMAAIGAIRNGDERISVELLDAIRWTPPSKRRQRPPMM